MTVLQTIVAVEIFAVAAVAYLVILFACCTCVVLEQQSLVSVISCCAIIARLNDPAFIGVAGERIQ